MSPLLLPSSPSVAMGRHDVQLVPAPRRRSPVRASTAALSLLLSGAETSSAGLLAAVESTYRGTRFGLSTLRDMVLPTPSSAPPSPPTEMKVFVAGHAPTGSASIARALEELGYRPCWGPDMFGFADEIEDYASGNIDGSGLLEAMGSRGYDATGLDIFGWSLYRDAARIPGAKMILAVRDPDGWAESVAGTVALHFAYFDRAPFVWLPLFRKINPYLRKMVSVMTAGHPDDPTNLEHLRRGYTELEEEVRRAVHPDNLLVYNVKEGWAPLCQFLELGECPSTPFPHVNDRVAMVATTYVLWIVTWIWPVLLVLPLVLLWKTIHPSPAEKRTLSLEDYSTFQYMLARPHVAKAVTDQIVGFVFYDEPHDGGKPESEHAVLVKGTTNVLNYYYCCLFELPSHILGMSKWVSAENAATRASDGSDGKAGDVLRRFKYEYYNGLIKVDTHHVRPADGNDDRFRLVEYFDCPISVRSFVRFFLFAGISAFLKLLQTRGILGNSYLVILVSSIPVYVLLQASLFFSGVKNVI